MPRRTLVLAVCALALLPACSSSSPKAAPKSSTTTSSTVKIPDGFTGGDKVAFCAAWADVKARSYIDNGSDPQKIKEHYTSVGEAARRLQAASPKEIAEAVAKAVQINDQAVAQGSLKPFDGEENQSNGKVIAAYADHYCPKK